MKTYKEFKELKEGRTLTNKQWQMFQQDITKLVKFMGSPDGMEMDDKKMKAFLTDMEKVFNKHLMKNDIRIS